MSEIEQETGIVLAIAENPLIAITNPEKFAEFLGKIKDELDAHKPDVSTPKGRKEIASMAFKVTRAKTAIDAAGKELNAAKRAEIDKVDEERRDIRSKLDALAEEIRKPLTDWEDAEEKRLDRIVQDRAIIADLSQSIHPGDTSDEIRRRYKELSEFHPDSEIHQDDFPAIVDLRQHALEILSSALDRALKYEADQAELARLRAEAEAREAADRERAEKEAAAKAEADRVERERKAEQERAEREAAAAQQAEAYRLAAIERAAEEARQAEIRKAKAEQEERDRAAQAEIEAANKRAAELERQAQERAKAEERAHAEQAARDADRKHRGEVMRVAKEAMMNAAPGINEIAAKQIVLAIIAGEIPNVTLRF